MASSEKGFLCGRCPETFVTRTDLRLHLKTSHSDHNCPICQEGFVRIEAMEDHMRSKHLGLGGKCKKVVKGRSSSRPKSKVISQRSHRLINKPKEHVCETCGKMFYHKRHFDRHMQRDVHEGIKSQCEKCGKEVANLELHMRTVHLGIKDYKCEECGKEFTNPFSLKAHCMSVHLGKRLKCDECEKEYANSQTLRNHFRSAHLGKKLKCDQCDKEYANPFSLKTHYMSLHLGKRAKCDQCDKEYANPFSLKHHYMSVHLGKRTKCDQCDKEYANPFSLKTHYMSYTSERGQNVTNVTRNLSIQAP